MELKAFKERNNKKTIIWIGIGCIILLLAAIFLYRTFAIYEEKNTFDVIKGQVPDQYYDAMFSYYTEDDSGKQTFSSTMPSGKDYTITVSCDNGVTGSWNYDSWGVQLNNLSKSKTKCKIIFVPGKPLTETIKSMTTVTTGTGLYSVDHSDASITYTTDTTAINNLKQTELRYAGKSPNNYVTFNGESAGWRIIGLVNTPEGQRIKLVRKESIGGYSWDSSTTSANLGYGISEWSQADLMTLLNSGSYYNRTSGTCYNGMNGQTTSCNFSGTYDFSVKGLTTSAKNMIDKITWNYGKARSATITTKQFYNSERSRSDNGPDSVWQGEVVLIYPSDYGYATSGGSTTNRNTCLSTNLDSFNSVSDCYSNDWLMSSGCTWTLTAKTYDGIDVYVISYGGNIAELNASGSVSTGYVYTMPSLYLKTNVIVESGDGTQSNPYVLAM